MPKTQSLCTIPAVEIKPNSWNPKKALTDRQRDGLRSELSQFGQVQTITIAIDPEGGDDYIIVDGEDRWRELTGLNAESIDVTLLEGYSLAELKAITIAMNQVRGVNDTRKRKALMRDIQDDLGIDHIEFGELFALDEIDWLKDTPPDDPPVIVPSDEDPPPVIPELKSLKLDLTEESYAELMQAFDELEDGTLGGKMTSTLKKLKVEMEGESPSFILDVCLRVRTERQRS